jgi:hypothetical protein
VRKSMHVFSLHHLEINAYTSLLVQIDVSEVIT